MAWSAYQCLFENSLRISNFKSLERKVMRYNLDQDREKRLEKQECKYCYIIDPRIGGQAMTHSQCAICGGTIINSSTCVDKICKACAAEHSLCKHCGGDLEMRQNRRKFKFDSKLNP